MNILVVEDDEDKRARVVECMAEIYPAAVVREAGSFQGALRAIARLSPELLILDMTLPTFDIGKEEDGGRPQAFAGRDILQQLERRGVATDVVVVTQFDKFGKEGEEVSLKELDEQLREAHPSLYRGCVYYNVELTGWKEELAALRRSL